MSIDQATTLHIHGGCIILMMLLVDLSGDGLRGILQHLEAKDLCRCRLVCRKLQALASEDMLWEAQSLRWFRQHGKHSGLCNVNPSRLRSHLRHTSFATMYQVLHSLGGWPEGLWYRTDAAGQPRGALIWVQLRGATLHVIQIDHAGNLAARFCRIDLGASAVRPPDLSSALRIMVRVFIDASSKNHDSPKDCVALGTSAFHINSSAGTMVLQRPHCSPDPNVSPSKHAQNQYYNLEPESHYLWPYGEFLRLYRIAHLPSPLPDIRAPLMPPLHPGFTAAQALRRLEGLWRATYGGHGHEILHVWFDETLQSHNGAPILEGPNARPRLVGCKVTGDPNVPANHWSFVAQAGEMKQGRWDGRGSWIDESEDLEYRPIVSFPGQVNMRERQVLARFLCHGCINHTPADFKPEWVPAQLLLYEGPKPIFSVLFDDLGQWGRHIMDFGPVPLPCKPTLSWLQDVQPDN